MKEKLISRLVMGALVGLAATGAHAGQIQSSSVSIAREVVDNNDQLVTSPRVAYRFSGDVDARSQNQTFQVQFALQQGALWDNAGVAAHVVMTDGVTGTALVQGTGAGEYSIDKLDLSADKKILYATITLHQGAAALAKQPLISVASSSAANNPEVKNLFDVVQKIEECDVSVKTLRVNVKHFVALSDPGALATEATATPDEHLRAGSTNETTLITFPTNIAVVVTKADGNAKLDVAQGNTRFAGTTGSSYISNVLANLGTVSLKQNASAYDADLTNAHVLTGNPAGGGIDEKATATLNNGNVEAKEITVKVSASQGFVKGGSLFLSSAANCGAAIAGTTVAVTDTNKAGPITLKIDSAVNQLAMGNSGTGPVHVCYGVAGVTDPIPGSSFYVDAATLVKADAGGDFNEQNNFCKGGLYSLTGSIKIDVRNYAANAREDGWLSIVRLINNSEVRTVDVFGQYIHADGQYGKWGKLATLKPRAVLNMLPADVAGKLTTAPAHPTSDLNATADVPKTGDAPRLRITSENGDTLRVQNYLYNPATGNFIEASSSQGVDFTGTTDRAPTAEGQYTEQDAQKGINGGN